MEYITYDEYTKIGGVLDVAAFNRYSIRAFSIITKETHARMFSMADIPSEVKHLCRDLIEYLSNYANSKKAISSASQSQGGASESESYVVKTNKDVFDDIDAMMFDYLASVVDDKGTPLLYRGCSN